MNVSEGHRELKAHNEHLLPFEIAVGDLLYLDGFFNVLKEDALYKTVRVKGLVLVLQVETTINKGWFHHNETISQKEIKTMDIDSRMWAMYKIDTDYGKGIKVLYDGEIYYCQYKFLDQKTCVKKN